MLPANDKISNPSNNYNQECYNIQKPFVNAILPKMGISRKTHRSVVFGTDQFGGLGLEHLAAYQGHNRLQYLMGHLRCNSTTGKLMRSILDYTQLECGCLGNVLEEDYEGPDYGKLDYQNMGTPALVQINTEDNCGMETSP
jgi:hypothetical protein